MVWRMWEKNTKNMIISHIIYNIPYILCTLLNPNFLEFKKKKNHFVYLCYGLKRLITLKINKNDAISFSISNTNCIVFHTQYFIQYFPQMSLSYNKNK